jgi:hypothetical protein
VVALRRPPTREEWALDGLTRGGHTPAEVLAWSEWVDEFEDWQAARRRQPGFVVTIPGGWWRGWSWLRRRR